VDPRAATPLKYRFGDIRQMHNHLHIVEGRTLFFFRDSKTHLGGGARVVVEFSMSNSEQVSTLRGNVLARIDSSEGAGQAGMWIEFPDARLARRIDQGAAALAGRKQRRLGCDFLVEVRVSGMPYLARIIDVGMTGARVVGAVGLRAGAQIEMRLMGAEPPLPSQLGRCEVVRSESSGGDVGVRFVRSDVIARVAAGKLFAAVQEAWAKAPELSHSPLCCQGGHVLEPPLPHMKART